MSRAHAKKLTRNQVLAIRADRRSQKDIAYSYGLSDRMVLRIKGRKAWSWVRADRVPQPQVQLQGVAQ